MVKADEKKKTTEDDELPVNIQQLFDERHYRNISKNFGKSRNKIERRAILIAALILIGVFFLLPGNRVRSINVHGNTYVNEDYIMDAAGISTKSKYLLVLPDLVEYRLKQNPFILDAQVDMQKQNNISITVTENTPVGYRYEDEPYVLFTNNEKLQLKSEYLDIISKIPMITGFEKEEQTRLLCKAFSDIDKDILEDISEIKQYDLGYDNQAIEVLMRNGGYFFGNYYNMSILNQYYAIYTRLEDTSKCIFADDNMKTAYGKACPWDETPIEREYWIDDDGEIITNIYGDYVVKHYYTLENGEYATDGEGNPIPIPINPQGFEEEDAEFLNHYYAGYYYSGHLELPE